MRLAIAILFASCLVAVAAPAPIQHNPWTTTTNDPSVTLQATQPVSITTTSNISMDVPSLIRTTNSVNGPLCPLSFGSAGNGIADDTATVQATINAAAPVNSAITLNGKIYLVNSLTGFSNTKIIGPGTLAQTSGAQYVLSFNPNSGGTTNLANNLTNIVLSGVTFKGRADSDGFSEHRHLLNLNAVSHVLVDSCRFLGSQGDGIYVGSGNTGGIERHNSDVTVTHCYFDGLVNTNRNAISTIDCDGAYYTDNAVYRYSQVGMPGAFDFEPNDLFNVIRNVRVANNYFASIAGGYGAVIASESQLTNPVISNIEISGNTFETNNTFGGSAIAVRTRGVQENEMAIRIENNTVKCPTVPLMLFGTYGSAIKGNVFTNCSVTVLGLYSDTSVVTRATSVTGNRWQRCGNSVGTIVCGNNYGLTFSDNLFDGTQDVTNAPSHITFFGESPDVTTSSNVVVTGNTFFKRNAAMTKAVTLLSATSDQDKNRYWNNVSVDAALGSDLPFNNDEIRLSDFKVFTTTNTPDWFQVGRSVTTINGDTNAPDLYSQGILVTLKINSAPGYRNFTHQFYYPAGNGVETNNFYYRAAQTPTDSWHPWCIFSQDIPKVFSISASPEAFPVGRTMTVINGDTNAPDAYYQGILVTYRASSDTNYDKFATQWYYSANTDAATLEQMWWRKGTTNNWSQWWRVVPMATNGTVVVPGSFTAYSLSNSNSTWSADAAGNMTAVTALLTAGPTNMLAFFNGSHQLTYTSTTGALRGDGSQAGAGDLTNGVTGTSEIVLKDSPVFTTKITLPAGSAAAPSLQWNSAQGFHANDGNYVSYGVGGNSVTFGNTGTIYMQQAGNVNWVNSSDSYGGGTQASLTSAGSNIVTSSGALGMKSFTTTPTGPQLGVGGAALWSSNAVVYVSYSSDGAAVTTKQIAP